MPKRRRLTLIATCFLTLFLLVSGGTYFTAGYWAPGTPESDPLDVVDYATLRDRAPATAWTWSRLNAPGTIIVLEFPSLKAQASTLNRVAAFIETIDAPRDRVLNDLELAALIRKHGHEPATHLYGHNYRPEDLAHFFAQADLQSIVLNDEEYRLRDTLIAFGILVEMGHETAPTLGEGAFVSYVREQDDDPRTSADETLPNELGHAVLVHELSHGIFYTNSAFRAHSQAFWDALDPGIQSLFHKHLEIGSYDITNPEIVVNETQAFLIHTPDERAFSAAHLGISDEDFKALQMKFLEGMPSVPLPRPTVSE